MRKIQSFVYFFIYLIAKKTLESEEIEVWARNSFYFKNISSFKSDIDLTLYFKSLNKKTIEKTLKKYFLLKKYFPVIGEINTYSKEDLSDISTYSNYYELKRDPVLYEKIKEEGFSLKKRKTTEEKKVFISRMARANLKQLLSNKENKKKWRFYFEHCGINSFSSNQDILLFLNIKSFNEIESSLIYNPVYFLTRALKKNEIKNLIHKIKNLQKKERDILKENFYWEIVGSQSQRYMVKNQQLKDHLSNIQLILKAIL